MTLEHHRKYKVPIANVIKTVPISTKPKDMITSVNGSDYILSYGVTVLLQVHDTRYKNPERQTNTNIKINTLKQLQNQYNIQLWLQKIYIPLTHINLFSIHQCITHQCINHHSTYISHSSTCIKTHIRSSFIHQHSSFIHPSTFIIHSSTIIHSFINIHASTFITRYLNTSYMHHTSKTSHITNYV